MKKEQKKLVIIGVVALVIMVLVGGAIVMTKQKAARDAAAAASPAPKKKRISDPVNVIPVTDRPYVRLLPKDGHNVTLEITSLKKPATDMDYELEYQTESNLEGAIGELTLGQLPVLKDILLGSCSAGGACRYHKDVKGGTLLMRFSGGEQSYAVKQDWKYIENIKKETMMSSRDAKFQLDSKDLAKVSLAIIYNAPGYPGEVAGTVVSDVYVFSPLEKTVDQGTVSIRMSEDAAGAEIKGWDGTTWQSVKTTIADKVAKGTDKVYQAYVVVKK